MTAPKHPCIIKQQENCTTPCCPQVLVHALGSSNATFSIGSQNAPAYGLRTYNDVWSAAVGVGDSRSYGGVHFPKFNVDGLILGTKVANVVLRDTYRRPRYSSTLSKLSCSPCGASTAKWAAATAKLSNC